MGIAESIQSCSGCQQPNVPHNNVAEFQIPVAPIAPAVQAEPGPDTGAILSELLIMMKEMREKQNPAPAPVQVEQINCVPCALNDRNLARTPKPN